MNIIAEIKRVFVRPIMLFLAILLIFSISEWFFGSQAATKPAAYFAGDNCTGATVIAPAALPFIEDATTFGAANDIDPTAAGCAPGGGADVVYRFTPSETANYAIGVTPFADDYDTSLYVLTDCSTAFSSCVAGSNENGPGRGETLIVNLAAGNTYFIVVDAPTPAGGAGAFHFSLRKGAPTNDGCSSPTIIEASRLPFMVNETTVGASNDLNPQTPCLRSRQAGRGPEVIYQFTSADSQTYNITATPVGNFDVTLYITTNCTTYANCTAGDTGGAGLPETIFRNLAAGTTYYIVVDGNGTEAGDFNLSLIPSIPRVPNAPTNLTAAVNTSGGQLRVDLQWQGNSDNELGFRIERSFDAQNWEEIGTTGANVATFTDPTVAPNTVYFYRVFAFNNFGNSEPSNIADVTTPAPPPPPQPVIAVNPTMIDFGLARAPITQTVTITNNGGTTLQITQISDPAAPFSIVNKPTLPLSIAPGQSAGLTVRFAPITSIAYSGSFTISSNDPLRPTVTVDLRGQGSVTPVPNLDLSSVGIDFPGGSSSFILEIKNTGDADLVISSIGNLASPFFVSGQPTFPAIFKPGEGFLLTVAFSPSTVGVFQSALTIVSNDPDNIINVVHVRGTSTTTNEQLKLRVPTLVTGVAGSSLTLNVAAVNGTNSDIRLTAVGLTQGGTFTDRGNGKGDFVINLPAGATGRIIISFQATDSANRQKTAQSVVTIFAAENVHNVQIVLTAPETASNPPTGVFANDQSITPLGLAETDAATVQPQVAAGLTGYLVYRSESANFVASAANLVAVLSAAQTAYVDKVPAAAGSPKIFYYKMTALYSTGTESAASSETSTAPRMINAQYKKKQLRFQAANSNIAAGAVVIVNGRESFPLTRSGDLIVVDKNATSTPGGLKQKGFVQSGSQLQIRNPNGATSAILTL